MPVDLFAPRPLFEEEHLTFGKSVREFLAREAVPHIEEWEDSGEIPREVWAEAGRQGLLSLSVPEEFGGLGVDDWRFSVAQIEEFARAGATSLAAGFSVHANIVLPYLVDLATPEQAEAWLPSMVTGEKIGAIAMTEPGTGSDLQGIRTKAVRDGDGWIIDGAKTFITNGVMADRVLVVARTNSDPAAGSKAFSIFVVETGTPGFERGRRLKKVGLKAQDTAELSFRGVRVGADAMLGEEGAGMRILMSQLPLERLSIAVAALAGTRAALAWTLEYIQERTAFGKQIATYQNTQFAVAEMVTELDVAQAYVDNAVLRFNAGELSAVDAAKAKWYTTEMHKRIVDRCVQLFGGYGYMLEYPIARAYVDTRVTTIYGGTTEIMKLIIARDTLGVR